MSAPEPISLPFPVLGLDKRSSIRDEPPFTTSKAVNVRPVDQAEGRHRGGTRPGFLKAFTQRLNTGPVRSMAQMNIASVGGSITWEDPFDGTSMLSVWTAPTFQVNSQTLLLPRVASDSDSNNLGTARIGHSDFAGAVRDDFTDFDVAQPYIVTMKLYHLHYHLNHHYVFLRMDNATPDVFQDGLILHLQLDAAVGDISLTADITGEIESYVGGVLQNTYSFSTGNVAPAGVTDLSVSVSTNTIVVNYAGFEILNTTISESQAGRRVGFSMEEDVVTSFPAAETQHVDVLKLQYQPTTAADPEQRRLFTAISGGDVFAESNIGNMEVVSSSLTLRSDVTLQSIEHLSKLYIADYGEQVMDRTDGTIGVGGLILDTVDAGIDFAALGVDANDHLVEIYDPDSNAIAGIYAIDTVDSGPDQITLLTSAGTSGGTCSFRIERGPKIFDPVAGTLVALVVTDGQIPFGYSQVTRYKDRLCWAGHIRDGRLWEQSRQGNPLSYDFSGSSNSIGRAVSGQASEAGVIAAPVTAQIPHAQNYMVYAALNSMHVLRGDATAGGSIDEVSRVTGVVGEDAYCWGPNGEIVFLARDGIYELPFGARQAPRSLSLEKLPRELRNIDPLLYKVGMEYDSNERGIHIFVTPLESGTPIHFWFDWELKGFWSVELPLATMEPFVVTRFSSDTISDNAVVFGCRDGFIRKFENGVVLDDASTIPVKLYIGPFLLGANALTNGILQEMEVAMGLESSDATWSLYVGETPEDVIRKEMAADTPFATGTFTSGLNRSRRPGGRGNSALIVLENSGADGPFVFNELIVKVERLGRQKLGV